MGPLKRKSSTVKLGEKWKLTKTKSMSGRKKNSKKRLSDIVDEATKSDREEDKDEDAKEQKKIEDEKKQEEEKKARFPIAPDGYLPNSVIRKIIKPPADTPVVPETTEEPWKLKPVPKMDAQNQPGTLSRLSDYDVTLYLSDTSMSNPNDDAEDRTQEYDEMTAVQAHHMSRESTSIPAPGRELSNAGQQNLLNSEATVLSKGRPLFSNMSRQATSAISEEGNHGTELIQRITEEPWFPTDVEATMNGVVNAFISIMDDVSAAEHGQICDYIIQINRDTGLSDELLEKIADKLTEQLSSSVPDKRVQALRVISELELNRPSIIKEILSLLAHPNSNDELHQLAEDTLIKLTGAIDKETLDKQLCELGLADQKSNNNEEVKKETVDEEIIESQNTNENMSVLPEATQDQLVETWLEGTKGVEKDLTGLYREDSEISRKESADSKHSNSSKNSRESSKTKVSKHTDVDYDSDVSSLSSSGTVSRTGEFQNSFTVSVGDIKDQMAREYSETRVPPATRANTMTSLLSDGPRPPESGQNNKTAANRWKSSVRRHLLQGRHTKTLSRIPSASSHKQSTSLQASSAHVRSMPALIQAVTEGSVNGSGSATSHDDEEADKKRSPGPAAMAWAEHESTGSARSSKRSSHTHSSRGGVGPVEDNEKDDDEDIDIIDDDNTGDSRDDGSDGEEEEELILGSVNSNSPESNASQEEREKITTSSQNSGRQNVLEGEISHSERSQSRDGNQDPEEGNTHSVSDGASQVPDDECKENNANVECLSNGKQVKEDEIPDELKRGNDYKTIRDPETGVEVDPDEGSHADLVPEENPVIHESCNETNETNNIDTEHNIQSIPEIIGSVVLGNKNTEGTNDDKPEEGESKDNIKGNNEILVLNGSVSVQVELCDDDNPGILYLSDLSTALHVQLGFSQPDCFLTGFMIRCCNLVTCMLFCVTVFSGFTEAFT